MITHPLFHILISFALGAAMAFAMAPYHLWPLLFLGFGGFYCLLERAESTKFAALLSFVFIYGYFALGLAWIGNALLVEGNHYQWAYPLALLGIPIGLTPWFVLAGTISKAFFDLGRLSGLLAFTGLAALSEWVRGVVIMGGFPWNSFGYGWSGSLEILQIVHLDNIYILTFLAILWGVIPGFLLVSKIAARWLALIFLLTLPAVYLYGSERIANAEITVHEDVQVKIVQANIAQADKWDPEKFDENLAKHVRLSINKKEAETVGTTYLIWPETTLNFRYLSHSTSRFLLKRMLYSYQGDIALMSGFLRAYPDNKAVYNSLVILDRNLESLKTYDKHHLVPFGEYIPFQKWIPLAPITQFTGFVPGDGPQIIESGFGHNLVPLICYEGIFPYEMPKTGEKAPNFLLNVVNDAWYGDSAGPYQHFDQGRVRAIETGMPFIRSTSTGISGIVDPYGRILAKSNLFEESVITAPLPKNLSPERFNTPVKGILFFIFIAISLALAVILRLANQVRN